MSELKYAKRLARSFMLRKKASFCLQDLSNAGSFENIARKMGRGQQFFRSVPWDESPTEVKKLSYPPKEYVNERGRCNEVRQSVFYASTELSAVFAEQKRLSVGSTYAIGQWNLNTDLWAQQIGFPHGHLYYPEIFLNSSNAVHVYWNSVFYKCFRKRGSDKYHQTIAIYKNATSTGIRLPNGEKAPLGVIFPSVDHPNPGAQAVNFACDSQVADGFFSLVGAIFVKITSIVGSIVEYEILEEAEGSFSDGHIHWKRPYTLAKLDAADAVKVVIPSAKGTPFAVTSSGREIKLEPKIAIVDFNTNHPDYGNI
jgi:hypothetical protein